MEAIINILCCLGIICLFVILDRYGVRVVLRRHVKVTGVPKVTKIQMN
ncbi:hypothetical protein [Chitinophaga sp. sic0106]|nr:hypothetical protein [Chitinophaga sp. sic0106]MBV7534077.1 hypothetical protein [Chitinophaga sp. sic0106]